MATLLLSPIDKLANMVVDLASHCAVSSGRAIEYQTLAARYLQIPVVARFVSNIGNW